MDVAVARHCHELNRCNQRGGRMLSILDLIDAQTVDLELAALLMAGIARGASFIVGARPGGAGKTTVMCALLNLIPSDCEIKAATTDAVQAASRENTRRCYVCHEIGAGPWFAYLWDADLRAYCALAPKGHILATNLHADDLEETRSQICDENGVPENHFNAFHLAVFLRVKGGFGRTTRWIDKVYAGDGAAPHKRVFDSKKGIDTTSRPNTPHFDPAWVARCRSFLEKYHPSPIRTIEDLRQNALVFFKENGA